MLEFSGALLSSALLDSTSELTNSKSTIHTSGIIKNFDICIVKNFIIKTENK